MSSDAKALVERFRSSGRDISKEELEQLNEDSFHESVCREIYWSGVSTNHGLLKAILRDEISRRLADECHSGDRIVLTGLLLGLCNEPTDVFLLWDAKNVDFDMGCYFDAQILTLGGFDETLEMLGRSDAPTAPAIADFLTESKAAGDFDDMSRYATEKLAYFGFTPKP